MRRVIPALALLLLLPAGAALAVAATPAKPAVGAAGRGSAARGPASVIAAAPVPWNATSALAMAETGARWAPRDLARNVLRRYGSFRAGVREGLEMARQPGPPIEKLAADLARRSREDLRTLRPFADFVRDLGRLAGVLVAANQPLAASEADPREPFYRDDFLRYFEAARPRYAVARYSRGPAAPDGLAAAARARGRAQYETLSREYRRAGAAYSAAFDDRSAAFAVAALAHNHAASDVAAALRWVWLQSGGADGSGATVPAR